MNREKIAWLVSLILIGYLAFDIPGTMAQRDDDYSFVRTIVDIHRQVSANYVDEIDESKLRQSAIEGMLSELDPYSIYVPPAQQEAFDRMLEGSFRGVGIQLNQLPNGHVEVVTPIDGSPAHKAGVMAGDIILKVNGESVEGLKQTELVKKIAGPLGSEVKLSVRHATGDEAELKMTREEIIVPTVKGYSRKDDNTWDWFVSNEPKIAYVRITQFTPDTFKNLATAITQARAQGMRGLILDLRFNPGGRLDEALRMVDALVEKGTLLVTKGRNRPESKIEATEKGTLPDFPLIVLINEHSASASEIVAGSLMDNKRALVIGQRSYGKGSVQEVIPLDSKGGELKLTVAYYYLPSGRLVHRKKDATDWGVEPQIVVPMDNNAERKLMEAMRDRELFHRPTTSTSTQPTTQPMFDAQMQRAIDTMTAILVLGDGKMDPAAAVLLPESKQPIIAPKNAVPESPDSTTPTAAPTTAPATTEPTTKP